MSGRILQGDALEVLKTLPTASVDSIVTDPPSGIGFMQEEWDTDKGGRDQWIAWLAAIFQEARRVLKPGGHAFVWALPRTSHWTAFALENAGFEIRDSMNHVFGCLSEDTEILTQNGWVQYRKCVVGNLALCYNVNTQQFGWESIQEVLTYDYNDTAYRLHSDRTDQLVSRNHRCIVERGGEQVFQYAETLQSKESVPILEDLSVLLKAFSLPYERASDAEQDMFPNLCREADTQDSADNEKARSSLLAMRKSVQAQKPYVSKKGQVLQRYMLREMEGGQSRDTGTSQDDCQQGQGWVDGRQSSILSAKDERREQSGMEGRRDDEQTSRELQRRDLCSMPNGVSLNGSQGWVCDTASLDGSTSDRTPVAENRGRPSYQSQFTGQSDRKPSTLCQQQRSQAIRASRFTSSDLVTVTPVHYQGVVWCIRVPSGAFVARRNGKVFVTGNSGMPKSHNVGKAIDKMAGAEREATGPYRYAARKGGHSVNAYGQWADRTSLQETAPATPEAERWDGWGTGLKPAHEVWWLARSPLSEPTVAANVLRWGTGALNIDASRIEAPHGRPKIVSKSESSLNAYGDGLNGSIADGTTTQGRWPANFLLSHSIWCRQIGTKRVKAHQHSGKPGSGAESMFGMQMTGETRCYADSDGLEEVEAWECVPDCPIAMLDEQSGVSKSTGGGGYRAAASSTKNGIYGTYGERNLPDNVGKGDEGGASRYFATFAEEEEWECAPDCPIALLNEQGGLRKSGAKKASHADNRGGMFGMPSGHAHEAEEGYASRYFASFYYCAKPSRRERNAGLDKQEMKFKVRDDLTDEQRAYVFSELAKIGVAS